MNRQPSSAFPQAPPSADRPGPPIFGRVVGIMRGLTGLAGAVSLVGLMGEAVLPAAVKPSVLIGSFHGRIEAADANAKVGAVANLTRQNAEAAAEPPAVAQMETEAFRVQQQAIADSLGVQSGVANMADLACVIGTIIPRGGDGDAIGQGLRGACGVGDQVCSSMVETLKRGGQSGSTLIQRPLPPGSAGSVAPPAPRYLPVRP
jgi:hypothetical protein